MGLKGLPTRGSRRCVTLASKAYVRGLPRLATRSQRTTSGREHAGSPPWMIPNWRCVCVARNGAGLRRGSCVLADRPTRVEDEDNQPPDGNLSTSQQEQVGRTSRCARISGWADRVADAPVRLGWSTRFTALDKADDCRKPFFPRLLGKRQVLD